MNKDSTAWFDQPPVPLEHLRQQSLKNRDYARTVLLHLPDDAAGPLRKELDTLTTGLDEAYEAGDAVAHYRLDRELFFQFMMKLSFAAQAVQNE